MFIHFLTKEELRKKGEEFIKKMKKHSEFFSKALESDEEVVPIKKGDIPKLAVLLGLLDPFYYELYQICDGKKDLNALAEFLGLKKEDVKILIDKLIKNGLVDSIPKELQE
ncbi:MAG: hypothetical protein ACTSVV_12870 [Promethearchaeota archaeon]